MGREVKRVRERGERERGSTHVKQETTINDGVESQLNPYSMQQSVEREILMIQISNLYGESEKIHLLPKLLLTVSMDLRPRAKIILRNYNLSHYIDPHSGFLNL